MVAWVGGANWSVGIAVGGGPAIGWFPLAPREVWVPAYHYSPAYIERVNVTNTVIVNRTVINNINVTNVNYVNRTVPGAVTVVPQSALTVGRPVATAAVRVPPDVVARAEVRNVAVVAPERGAVLGGRVQTSAAPPAALVNRTVVARQAPPPPQPAFAQQQQLLRQNPGQPVPRSSLAEIQQRSTPAQGGSVRPAIRQVGPPTAAPVQGRTNLPPQPAPAQTTPQPEFRRSVQQTPAQQPAAQQPEFRRTPPQQQPQTQQPAAQQPEFRRTPPQQQPQTQQPAAQQPEFRRTQPQQQPQTQQPAAQQPEFRRTPQQPPA
jgi:hypothetical protein